MLLFLSLGLGYIWVLSRTDALEEEAVRERKKYRYVRFVLKWFTGKWEEQMTQLFL